MIIKTSELTGAALDWAVAMAENWAGAEFEIKPYSTDPSQAYPIIFRECIGTTPLAEGFDGWKADKWLHNEMVEAFGPTPLIAAMRCYCASKLGDEVEVPKELV